MTQAPQLSFRPVDAVVGIGDCRIAGPPVRSLSTYALGSCIALTAWDWKLHAGGLLHVMLPDSSIDRSRANPFVYVDTGVRELLRKLEACGAVRKRLRCAMAGGANMMADSMSFEIGKRNHLAIRKACWTNGMFIDGEDVGGQDSRSLRLDLETGQVVVRMGSGEGRILIPARAPLHLKGLEK